MSRRSPHQLHSPSRVIMVRVFLAALVIVAGYLVFEFGRIQASYSIVDATRERRTLENHVIELQSEIETLQQEVALLETHREVDREAYNEVETSLVALQAKIQEQSDAIAFYRGIVSPKDNTAGLRVQDLKLSRGETEREYHVRLVLVQSLQHDRKVSGNVNFVVEGEEDGVATTYSFGQLLPAEASAKWPFSFRYFQDFDREIVLPDGFTPQTIIIEVRSQTRSISSIEESYPWAASLG